MKIVRPMRSSQQIALCQIVQVGRLENKGQMFPWMSNYDEIIVLSPSRLYMGELGSMGYLLQKM